MTPAIARVHICEPVSCAAEHAPFNASLLELLGYGLPGAALVFIGEHEHVREVKALVEPGNDQHIRYRARPIAPRKGDMKQRIGKDYCLLRYALGGLGQEDLLLVSATTPSVLFALILACWRSRSKVRVQAVMHGNLVDIAGWRSRGIRRFLDLRSAMSAGMRHGIQFIVLEEGIRQEATKVWPGLGEGLAMVEHPYPGHPTVSMPASDSVPGIGFLGMAVAVKGFDRFVAIAAEVGERMPGAVAFDAIGPLPFEKQARLEAERGNEGWPMLRRAPAHGWLDRDEYGSALRALHYVCLPYEPTHYRFSASGVLLDAIRFNKPVIALRNATLSNLFERYGDIGFLCESPDEMKATVLAMAQGFDMERYRYQCQCMGRLASDRLPRSQVPNYLRAVDALWAFRP